MIWGNLPMTCKVCTTEEGRLRWREPWGCDAEQPDPVWELEDLSGDRIPLYRCPNATVDPRALDVCRHAALLGAQVNAWPVAGGTMDQSATFLPAVQIALGYLGRYREQEMKRIGNGD